MHVCTVYVLGDCGKPGNNLFDMLHCFKNVSMCKNVLDLNICRKSFYGRQDYWVRDNAQGLQKYGDGREIIII